MKISFFKYLFWGLVGLFIQTHGAGVPVDFFVLSLALSYPVLGLGPSLILALALSLFYGGHSVSPWAVWWLPSALILLLLRLWKSYLVWPRWMQRATGMTLLTAGQWAWGVAWGGGLSSAGWGLAQTWAGTLAFGILLIPIFNWVREWILQRLPRPRPRMGELPLYWQNMKSPPLSRERRRPFGLERV